MSGYGDKMGIWFMGDLVKYVCHGMYSQQSETCFKNPEAIVVGYNRSSQFVDYGSVIPTIWCWFSILVR